MATTEEILTWAADGGDIPTEAGLHNWLAELTAEGINDSILSQLQFQYEDALHLWLPFRIGVRVSAEDSRRNPLAYENLDILLDEGVKSPIDLFQCLKVGESELPSYHSHHERQFPLVIAIPVQTGSFDDRYTLPMAPRGPIEEVHKYWLDFPEPRPEHPLIPLIKAWQEWQRRQARPDRTDRRRLGLLPVSIRDAQQAELFGTLPQDLDRVTPLGQLQDDQVLDFLPGFEPPTRSVIPPLCIGVYTVNGGGVEGVTRRANRRTVALRSTDVRRTL